MKIRKPVPVATAVFSDEEANALYDVIKSTWVTMGPKVEEFENKFAKYTGSKHAIAMFNGTVTLHSALAALNISEGDEVIVPTLTYISSANVVLYQGATLVLCECDPETYNVRIEDIDKVVTSKTKAIITVDMNGMPIDYDSLVKYAEEKGIYLISDSAESLGSIYKDKPVGSQALIHSFSFFGNKNITTGEGGMLTTDDDDIAKELRILRNQGQTGRYNHTHLGYNYRMTEMQAALGIIQLKHLEKKISNKIDIVNEYNKSFSGLKYVSTPKIPGYVSRHAWYMYTLSFDIKIDRDKIVNYLSDKDIETRTSFPPVHIQPYYAAKFGFDQLSYPLSYEAWGKLINLPICSDLSPEERNYVVESINQSLDLF